MKLVVVSIFDKASLSFSRPVFTTSEGVAIRSFRDEVNRVEPGNDVANHPEDFELFYLAEFDDQTGLFSSEGNRRLIRADHLKEV